MRTHVSSLFSAKSVFALLVMFFVLAIGVSTSFAQKGEEPSPENVNYDINQCSNGRRGDPKIPCTGSQWQNGNLGSSNSQYIEGDSVPYRSVMTGHVIGVPTNISFEWDTTKSGKHALDYITSFDRTETDALPCSGVTGCNSGVFTTFPIPADPIFAANCPLCTQIPGNFTIYNGVINSVSAYTTTGSYAGDSATSITLNFTPSSSTVVIAWGGHIARRADWGIDGAATNIPGSPYHMRLKDVTGNQDRSMSVNAIIFPGQVKIIKTVDTFNGFDRHSTSFPFTASANFGPNFSLVDNVTGAGGGEIVNSDVLLFGAANTITITEDTALGWTLNDISCVEVAGGLPNVMNSSGSTVSRTATIIVEEGESVTCTFNNLQLGPSAAPASVQGRVTTAEGRGIAGAYVTVFNASTGAAHYAVTNSFGYYRINDLPVSEFYIMTVNHKRYLFLDASRSFTLDEDMFSVDFTASAIE